jgi:hypothetical protein
LGVGGWGLRDTKNQRPKTYYSQVGVCCRKPAARNGVRDAARASIPGLNPITRLKPAQTGRRNRHPTWRRRPQWSEVSR